MKQRAKVVRAACVGSAALLIAAGCESPVATGLTERQANEVVVALDAAGIGASKTGEGTSGEAPTFRVDVGSGDQGRALRVLTAQELPREKQAGLGEAFAEASLVPTAVEERARLTAGLAGELAHSIESMDGVLSARVHIALRERGSLLAETPGRARASVLVRHSGARPPVEEAALRRLVAGAVDELNEADVAVVFMAAAAANAPQSNVVRLGPVSVSRGSAAILKTLIAVLLLSNMALAGALVFLVTRARKRFPAE